MTAQQKNGWVSLLTFEVAALAKGEKDEIVESE